MTDFFNKHCVLIIVCDACVIGVCEKKQNGGFRAINNDYDIFLSHSNN